MKRDALGQFFPDRFYGTVKSLGEKERQTERDRESERQRETETERQIGADSRHWKKEESTTKKAHKTYTFYSLLFLSICEQLLGFLSFSETAAFQHIRG